MSKYEAPPARKFTPAQEAEHARYEAKIAYVAEHRDGFIKLIVAANQFNWSLQKVVDEIGLRAHMCGQSFDESLFWMWLGSYQPHAQDWDFHHRPLNFEVIFSVLNKVLPEGATAGAHL